MKLLDGKALLDRGDTVYVSVKHLSAKAVRVCKLYDGGRAGDLIGAQVLGAHRNKPRVILSCFNKPPYDTDATYNIKTDVPFECCITEGPPEVQAHPYRLQVKDRYNKKSTLIKVEKDYTDSALGIRVLKAGEIHTAEPFVDWDVPFWRIWCPKILAHVQILGSEGTRMQPIKV